MKKKILIIDDDLAILNLFKLYLTKEGYTVDLAINGVDAEDFLKTEAPDLILLDLDMPTMNGFEFRKRQLKNEKLKSIPVILVSARDNTLQKVEALHPVMFLSKPIKPKELVFMINGYFRTNS